MTRRKDTIAPDQIYDAAASDLAYASAIPLKAPCIARTGLAVVWIVATGSEWQRNRTYHREDQRAGLHGAQESALTQVEEMAVVITNASLTPEALAEAWYWTEAPLGWVIGFGDIFYRVGYAYRDSAGLVQTEPVLAVCIEHPCDAATGLPRRVSFARAYLLDEYLADNPRTWPKLPDIAAGKHFDLCLLPARPGHWETELVVDLADDFAADSGTDFSSDSRLCGLRDGYWHTFAQNVARRASRAGVTHPLPDFRTVVIQPQEDGIQRPDQIPEALFKLPLLPGEADVQPNAAMGLKLTHLLRQQVQQHWWKAEWPQFPWLAGYALTSQAAIQTLVRYIRRCAAEPGQLLDEARRQFEAACDRAGITIHR